MVALFVAPGPAPAQVRPVLKLQVQATPARLLLADCLTSCWLSGFFAPAVVRDRTTIVPATNTGPVAVNVKASLEPTNGLAVNDGQALGLTLRAGGKGGREIPFALEPGEAAYLHLDAEPPRGLLPGAYAYQLQFTADAVAGNADRLAQAVAVDIRVRDSVFWSLLVVLFGILVGRISQLVYDPKLFARVELLDWLNEIGERIAALSDAAAKANYSARLAQLRRQLSSRGADAVALSAAIRELQDLVEKAEQPPRPAADLTFPIERSRSMGAGGGNTRPAPLSVVARALRVLAGVTPLPLRPVYDWLLPLLVLATLLVLMAVFVLQQYGTGGAAETFGAGGLADYAALFLAGVASEAIAGGLRTIKLR